MQNDSIKYFCIRKTCMTELEKCNAGLPYRFDDPEMVARKTRAITECERFNAIDGTDYEAQYAQLKRMLGSVGERAWLPASCPASVSSAAV